MSIALPVPRSPRVLGDVVPGGLARDAALIVGGAALISAAAQVAIPLPVTPVPLTLQTLRSSWSVRRWARCAASPRCCST